MKPIMKKNSQFYFNQLWEIEFKHNLLQFKVYSTPLWVFRTREMFFNFLKNDKINLNTMDGFLNYSKKKLLINLFDELLHIRKLFWNELIFFTNTRYLEKNKKWQYYVPYIDFFLKKYKPSKYLIINYEESNSIITKFDTIYKESYITGSLFLIILFFINKIIRIPKTKIIKYFSWIQDYINKKEFKIIKKSLFFWYKFIKQQHIFYSLLKKISHKDFKIIYSLSTFSNFYSVDSNVLEYQHWVITSTHPTYIFPLEKRYNIRNFLNKRYFIAYNKNTQLLLKENWYQNVLLVENSKISSFLKQNELVDLNFKKKDTLLLLTSPIENITKTLLKIVELFIDNKIAGILKLKILVHPNDWNIKYYYNFQKKYKNITVLYRTYSLYEELNNYYYVVSPISTVINEATYFNNFIIILNFDSFYDEYLDVLIEEWYKSKKILDNEPKALIYLKNNLDF